MDMANIKTKLEEGETIFFCRQGTIMKGLRVAGRIILTNKRFIWEKAGALNVAAFGVLSLAGKDYLSLPFSDIVSVTDYKLSFIEGTGAGIKFLLKTGEELKFQINGKDPKKARQDFMQNFAFLRG